MRNGIRQQLIQEIPLINGAVLEVHEAGTVIDKPYLLLIQGAETKESPWIGFQTSFEVWPFTTQTSFVDVDELSSSVVLALDGQMLTDPVTDEVFTCRYQGNYGKDTADSDRDGITRGLLFVVMAVQRYEETETVVDDTWLVSLAEWSESVMGPTWTHYRGKWPTDYMRPSVLWRLEGTESLAGNGAAIELRKRFVGHVLGRTGSEQISAASQLAEALSFAIKIPLDLPDRRYLNVQNPVVTLTADALTVGQINVMLSRKLKRQVEEMPIMQEIKINSHVD